jgi:tetratricopeptide (TPR) repeat protein
MSDRPFEQTTIAELERPEDGWSPIRRSLDVRAFGVNAWTAHEAGAVVIPEHDERDSGHEELYVVTAGHATFTVGDEQVDAPAGALLFFRDPALFRGAVARKADTTVLAIGAKVGEAYRPRAWETNADVIALLDVGRNEEAKTMLIEALDHYDDRGGLLYNLACAEAQLGRVDAALDRLAAALKLRPALAEYAPRDADFEPIRDDPRFAEIVAAASAQPS